MSTDSQHLSDRELELAAIIDAYNGVTERLKVSHEQLGAEVRRLRDELSLKNRQLRRRERLAALGELAAGVAHEIRNPLGGIHMFASLLRRDLADQPDALRLVEKIASGVMRLERIVTDILEFGRPAEPNPEPALLATVLAEVCELATGKRPGCEVCVDLAAGVQDLTVVTDAALLQRALLNLVLNGVQAGEAAHPDAAQVVLRCAAVDGRVTIEVIDNGAGFPEELRERIFNPFFTTKETGTGLGLAIVHQAIEMLGGTVTANNRPEGGAVFVVDLPVNLERQEVRQPSSWNGPLARKAGAAATRGLDVETADESFVGAAGADVKDEQIGSQGLRVTAAA